MTKIYPGDSQVLMASRDRNSEVRIIKGGTFFVKLIFWIFLDRSASSNNTLTQLYIYKIHHMVLQMKSLNQ
jgi:hypothetical protein